MTNIDWDDVEPEFPEEKEKPHLRDKFLPKGERRNLLLKYAGIAFLIIFVLYLITNNLIMPAITRHGSEFPLPDFTGMRHLEGQFKIEELNLRHEVASYEYSPGVERDVILNQFPAAGTKVKEGRTVKLVISQGQKLVPIPNIAGISVRQAILDLEANGLILGDIEWAFSDTLPEKVVVFSYPAAGTQIPLGAPVNLMVNRGRASQFTYVPGVTGLTLAEATARLEEKGLKVGIITKRTDENYLPETVLEQSETEGTELDLGTEIDLVISSTE